MTLVEVPVQLKTPPNDRADWASNLIDALGEYAAREMTFTEGTPTVRWENDEDVVVVVNIDNPESVDESSSFEVAGRRVVTSALFDLGISIDDAAVRDEDIKTLKQPPTGT